MKKSQHIALHNHTLAFNRLAQRMAEIKIVSVAVAPRIVSPDRHLQKRIPQFDKTSFAEHGPAQTRHHFSAGGDYPAEFKITFVSQNCGHNKTDQIVNIRIWIAD